MGAIDKLQQRPTFSTALVQQAMQEARGDATIQQQLQALVDQRGADFEDPVQLGHCQRLLQDLAKDSFQLVPNRQTGSVGRATVLEARITKVTDENRRVDITPPPPSPPVYRRDPLNVTGTAPANSKVEFYNASVPGRPVLGAVLADANGQFNYELTDETKFKFGDQIGVRLSTSTATGSSGATGRPLIVPTEPFLITNTVTTYFTRSGGVETDVRTDYASSTRALDKKTDDRPPFFQQQLVRPKLDIPAEVAQPYLFSLLGGDDSVEPNSSITVRVGSQVFTTKSDDMGQFALKVSDVIPGQRLAIEVRDLNGNGVDIPARVPPVALPQPQLLAGMQVGDAGLRVDVLGAVPPGGALIVRNVQSGVVSEVVADKNGKLSGVVPGIATFSAFEVAVRDVNGHVSEDAALFAALPPSKVHGNGVIAASSLDAVEPDLVRAFQAVVGPPMDLVKNGQTVPGGPYLPLPALPKLPAYAQLDVVKDGAVVQSFRADSTGSLEGLMRGVHVGDALSFRLKDAAGRAFPTQIDGFVVPDGKCGSTVVGTVPAKLQRLDATRVGSGTLTLDPEWLAPAKIVVGKHAPSDFQQLHAIRSAVGGAVLPAPPAEFMRAHLGDAATMAEGATLEVKHQPGSKWVSVDVPGITTRAVQLGWDEIEGTLHGVTEQSLPQVKEALRGALALVGAAYAQGKEPGDVSYDRAMGAAKTVLFMLDRFAVANPTAAKAAQDVAADVLGTKRFVLELNPRDVVGALPKQAIEAPSSSSLSLLQTRTLALGAVGRKDNLRDTTRPAVDLAALSSASSHDGTTLTIAGRGIVAAGDQLLIRAGDTVHVVTADAKGALSASLPIAPGTVIEVAQRGADETDRTTRGLNPIVRGVVVDKPILGEGQVVALDALVQRAPAAKDVVAALFGGESVRGLPPGGSVELVQGRSSVGSVAIDDSGSLGKIKGLPIKDGDIVTVRVRDAAGRPFAPVATDVVVGANAARTGQAKLDTDAMTIASVIDNVGSGALRLPKYPRGRSENEAQLGEAYLELKPFHGNSSSVSAEHGRYRTSAKVPDGLLPELANGPEKRTLSMGDSVKLSAVAWDDGTINVNAGFYVENQRPDFGFVFNEETGELRGRFTGGFKMPDELPTLSTFLKTSLAFVATAQKTGSVPGDGFYDLAARAAKSALVVADALIAQHPTYRTEILAAVRAAVPPSMPFDLAPIANVGATAQTPPADNVAPQTLAFYNAVDNADWKRAAAERNKGFPDVSPDALIPPRPNLGGGFFGDRLKPQPFFGGSRSLADVPAQPPTTPLYLRARER